MTREELQQKLQELTLRKKEAFRRYEARFLAIQETQQAALREINDRKFAYLTTLSHDKEEANRKMRVHATPPILTCKGLYRLYPSIKVYIHL